VYITTAYLYQQIQPVILVDITGAYFDRRWEPVYAKQLTLNLGVDNVFLFQFLNQDQKPVNITGSTFTFRIISENGENLLLAKQLVTLSAAAGRSKVTITAAETLNLQAQPASYSIEVASGVLEQAVYVDANAGARGSIEIVESVFPGFVPSAVLTIPSQAPSNSTYYTSTLTTSGRSLTTMQLDFENFTGNVSVQGATVSADTPQEWYDISFQDLASGNTVAELQFNNANSRTGINVQGFHPYVRLQFGIGNGNIDLITYR
jgi:hypothetical protein